MVRRRGCFLVGTGLAHGATQGRAATHAGGPAVVPHRHVLPLGSSALSGHGTSCPRLGMVLAGVEVRVIAHFHRHVHGDGRAGTRHDA